MAISASIKALVLGEQVAGSRLNSKLLDELMAEGLLSVVIRGSRKSYRARDVEALKRYLIDKDESYRMLEVQSSDSRASMAAETGNSKLMTVRSCPGFPVNSYEPISCSLCDKEFVVNPPEGSFVFIDNWQHFSVPQNVVVVGIENMENFRLIRRQRKLFESVLEANSLLFVSRYPQSTDLRNWLMSIPNRYVHFGDFDLAGVNIFLTEFQKYLGTRASYLIPSDIGQRIAIGSATRYNEQYARFHHLRSANSELQALIDLINKHHRGYDQEGYVLKQIEVVAAIIHRDGKIFATQRGYGDFKDWWEFPGGKMEAGETAEEALVREIREELSAEIRVDKLLCTVEYDYPQFHLTMHCYLCSLASEALHLNEHEAARWLKKDELDSVGWLPADLQVIKMLKNMQFDMAK